MAGGIEADDDRAVRLVLECLFGMKLELSRMFCGFRRKSPDHLAEFFVVLEAAKGAVGKRFQIKSWIPDECLSAHPRRFDSLGTEEPDSASHIFGNMGDNVPAQADENAQGCDSTATGLLFFSALIADVDKATGLERLGDRGHDG